MKPNFALSMSFDGIRLLQRAAGGWRVVGEVELQTKDLAGELAVLRRTATALDPSGLRSKLVVPESQVKYLTIETPGMNEDERRAAARVALDGATPYAVDDLAFDISIDGPRTHVAAVARETLAEAEAFASEHAFNPVSFATIPQDSPFLGEPYFGRARAAETLLEPGEEVEPDGVAVVVIGRATSKGNQVAPGAGGDADAADAQNGTGDEAPSEEAEAAAPATAASDEIADDSSAKAERSSPSHDAADRSSTSAEDTSQPLPQDEPATSEDDGSEATAASGKAEVRSPENTAASLAAEEPDADEPARDAQTEKPPEDATIAPLAFSPARNAPEAQNDSAPPAAAGPATDTVKLAKTDRVPMLPSLGAATRAAPAAAKPPTPLGAADKGTDVPGFASKRPAASAGADRKAPLAPAAPAAVADTVAPAGSFLSRRKTGKVPKTDRRKTMQTASPVSEARTEEERMTIFGARQREVGGKPRYLGLILTAALLVFLAGVAAWAAVFLENGLNLSRLFGDRAPRAAAVERDLPETLKAPAGVTTASLDPELTEEDTAVLDALRDSAPMPAPVLTREEIEAKYASTGIWPLSPEVPPDPARLISIDDLYLTSIDPVSTSSDAVALPEAASFASDLPLDSVASPAAAGTSFAFDDSGLIVPTAQGALSPDGYTVYLGRPPLVPPATPTRFQPVSQDDGIREALRGLRPQLRPDDLTETNERAQLDGLTRVELAGFRPQLRPPSVQEEAAAAIAPPDTDAAVEAALADLPETTPEASASAAFQNATKLAAVASARPDTRPGNFSSIVSRAKRTPQPDASSDPFIRRDNRAEEDDGEPDQGSTRVASVAPRTVSPSVPSKTSVARQATVSNAINLRKINLIGVYGKPSNRRALVRLDNGRYQKVVVGDRIDGGRVTAIGESELRYNRRGRDVVLKIPD